MNQGECSSASSITNTLIDVVYICWLSLWIRVQVLVTIDLWHWFTVPSWWNKRLQSVIVSFLLIKSWTWYGNIYVFGRIDVQVLSPPHSPPSHKNEAYSTSRMKLRYRDSLRLLAVLATCLTMGNESVQAVVSSEALCTSNSTFVSLSIAPQEPFLL